MTFLNASLAIGAFACVIPLVIHLLNRRRHRVVRWAAMHLITPISKSNRRRIRLEQLILLLIRMAILALLALCMAGPVMTGSRTLAGDAKTSLVVMLDNSYSMESGLVGATNLESAKRDAAELIEQQRRGSDVSLSLMAGGQSFGSTSPTMNAAKTAKELRELPGGFGAADVGGAFEHATRALAKMQNTKRDLVIVSDFQSKDWSADAVSTLTRATELIDAIPIRPTVTLMQVGREVTENVSIQSIEVSPSVVAVRQAATIRVNLRHHGQVPFPGIAVHLEIDGQPRETQSIDLGAGEDGQLRFLQTFDEAGYHQIEVRAEADTLHLDNRFRHVIEVFDRMPVLLVDGDPEPSVLKSEVGFLRLALSPFATAAAITQADAESGAELVDALATVVVTESELRDEHLVDPKVVILANVARLGVEQLRLVRDFVFRGGSLLVFGGDQIDTDWYRAKMCAETGMMPMTFDAVRSGLPKESDEVPASGVTIANSRMDHPALRLFNDPRHGVLGDATIESWYRLASPGIVINQQLQLTAEGTADLPTERGKLEGVIARLDGDDPFLVESSFGKGRVIVCATSCDADWSNLPSRPFFLPLMQRLVIYLATVAQPERNLTTGQTLAVTLNGNQDSATVTRPDGRAVEVSAASSRVKGLIEYADTDQEGWYTLQSASSPPRFFSVVAPRDESDLTRLDNAAMGELATTFDATVVRSASEFARQDSQRRYGREIWKELYAITFALIVAEVFLQQLFSGISFRAGGSEA